MANCRTDKLIMQWVIKCDNSLIQEPGKMFMFDEGQLKAFIYEVLQQHTELTPWKRAEEVMLQLKTKY